MRVEMIGSLWWCWCGMHGVTGGRAVMLGRGRVCLGRLSGKNTYSLTAVLLLSVRQNLRMRRSKVDRGSCSFQGLAGLGLIPTQGTKGVRRVLTRSTMQKHAGTYSMECGSNCLHTITLSSRLLLARYKGQSLWHGSALFFSLDPSS